MFRLFWLSAALLLLVSVLVGGCGQQVQDPPPPDSEQEEPAPPDELEPDPEQPAAEDPNATEGEDKERSWKDADQLEPTKTTILEIEGMEEELVSHLHVSSLHPYAIYLDEERYRLEEKEGKDYILPLTETTPEVFMAIWHVEGTAKAALAEEIAGELHEKYGEQPFQEEVRSPLPALYMYGSGGQNWDDTVERYYLLSDFEDGVFVVRQKLFVEAVEGHGTRFDGLLEDFWSWDPQRAEFRQP